MHSASKYGITTILVATLFGLSVGAEAASPLPSTAGISDEKIRQLCDAVSEQILSQKGIEWLGNNPSRMDMPGGLGLYNHEVIISDAAGVQGGGSPEVERNKIQHFWIANRDRLSC